MRTTQFKVKRTENQKNPVKCAILNISNQFYKYKKVPSSIDVARMSVAWIMTTYHLQKTLKIGL